MILLYRLVILLYVIAHAINNKFIVSPTRCRYRRHKPIYFHNKPPALRIAIVADNARSWQLPPASLNTGPLCSGESGFFRAGIGRGLGGRAYRQTFWGVS